MQVGAQTSIKSVELDSPLSSDSSDIFLKTQTARNKIGFSDAKSWMTVKEPIGLWDPNNFTEQGILEHLNVTKDDSDYLWHITR